MQTTIKLFIALILIISIAILVSRCKSGTGASAYVRTETPDSSSAVIETEVPADIAEAEVKVDAKDTASRAKSKTVATQKPLTVIVQNLEAVNAPVYISVYGTMNKFPEPKGQLKEYKFKAHGKELKVQIPNLKFGTYAIASYQDVNSSGAIDKNLIGIPTEGYAFSNNYKPTIKAPNFDDCRFDYNAANNSITIKMIR